MIRVLVVEDDFRVAQLHADFAEQVPEFRVAGTAHSAAEARQRLQEQPIDLVLLDNYLPDGPGIALLAELDIDAIMLTAASDPASVRAAFAAGALNYLIKPFTAEQLRDRLTAYARYHKQFSSAASVNQEQVDRAMRMLHEGDRPPSRKGQSLTTSRLVANALRSSTEPSSAAAIASKLGISRATAQRYLAALAEEGKARMSLRYGASGRPEHQYEWADAPTGRR